jgi:cephalosporin hydroxylase
LGLPDEAKDFYGRIDMDDHLEFKRKCNEEIEQQGRDEKLKKLGLGWLTHAAETSYSHHFEWLGRPIIQLPQDIVGVQQILWNVQPDLIVETGIARGGSLILYASMLELIAQCGGPAQAMVLGVDVDIRSHNKSAILAHPMSKRIAMIEGSSVADAVISQVREIAARHKRILVCLDSNHTHDHVLEELRLYAPLVSAGSYCIVFDTAIEDMPEGTFKDRPWGRGNNAKTAVHQFLAETKDREVLSQDGDPMRFQIDKEIENQLLITVAPDGYLRRVGVV